MSGSGDNKFSLWNIPRDKWSGSVDISDLNADEKTASAIRDDLRESGLEDRVRPYRTPLTSETLKQSTG